MWCAHSLQLGAGFSLTKSPASALSFTSVATSVDAVARQSPPLVFLHCLLGSHKSFQPLLSPLHAVLGRKGIAAPHCWFVDMRNHADAAYSSEHDYTVLSEDLAQFINHLRVIAMAEKEATPPPSSSSPLPILIGHSQGAKVAMAYALKSVQPLQSYVGGDNLGKGSMDVLPSLSPSPPPIAGFVSLDASPACYTHTHSHIFTAMQAINLPIHSKDADRCGETSDASSGATVYRTKHEVDAALRKHIPDLNDRSFVMGNVCFNEKLARFEWKCNLDVLSEKEAEIHSFPFTPEQNNPSVVPFEKDVLFIGGDKSTRLTDPRYLATVPAFFPKARIEMVSAGHFVHYASPAKTAELIAAYIERIAC